MDGVRRRVEDAGGAMDDGGELDLRRVVTSAGRSRAFVGGAPAPIAVLAELAEQLVAVHGQSDQIRLARPSEQRAALDRYAGIDLTPMAAAHSRWTAAVDALEERVAGAAALRREAELLAHGLAEIDAAAPQPGEDEELAALARRLGHADALRIAARTAHDVLLGDPEADAEDVGSMIAVAQRAVAQQSGADDTLDALGARLTELSTLAAELGADFGAYADDLDADPARLEQVEARRAVLNALVRRYGDDEPSVAGVLAWAAAARERLARIDVSDEALAALRAQRDEAARELTDLVVEVSTRRAKAADELAAAVSDEIAGLAMPDARVHVRVRHRPPAAGAPTLEVDGAQVGVAADGIDEVELLLQPHPASPALPVGKGASGGELSRVMLAIEVCLAHTSPVPTLVFDEVDAGVGGRAAVEVGRRLARLAREHQVIVVTHLAQVAAFADRHVVVQKPDGQEAGVTASDVRLVDGDERVAELARMLAGSDTATAREHAAELLRAAAASTA
jgi:DNA repair protein RecN (Recombination protein N)